MAAQGASPRPTDSLYTLPNTRLQGPADQDTACPSIKRVRVFDLDPIQDHQLEARTPISGTLRIVDLNDRPHFAALSYCRTQGIGERCRHFDSRSCMRPTVTCNGLSQVHVDANSLDALWHLRKAYGPRREPLSIWVEALCVNQEDEGEREVQPLIMDAIYSSAHVTYFWLGSGSKATDEAMNYLSSAATWCVGSHGTIVAWRIALALHARFLTMRFRPCFSKLDQLFGSPWIDCIWTLQATLRSRNATVVCGDKHLSWTTMIQALECIELHRTKSLGLLYPASFQPWRRLALLWLQLNPGATHHEASFIQTDSTEPLLPQHSGTSDFMAQILQQRRNFDASRKLFLVLLVALVVFSFILPLIVLIIFIAVPDLPYSPHIWTLVTYSCFTTIFLVEGWSSVRGSSIVLSLPISTGYRAIIEEIHRRHAADPRDRYFALLGLLSPGEPNTTRPRLRRSSGLNRVYKQLSRNIVQTSKSLEILLYATTAGTLETATWVVDWRTASDRWAKSRWFLYGKFGTSVFLRSILRRSLTELLDERAGTLPTARPHIEFGDRDNSKHLVVRGVIFARGFDYLSDEFVPITASTSPEAIRASVEAFEAAVDGLATNNRADIRDDFLCQLRWFASVSQPFGSGPPPGHYLFLFLLGCFARKLGGLFAALRDALPCFVKQRQHAAQPGGIVYDLWSGTAQSNQNAMSVVMARTVHEQVVGFLAKEDMRLVRFRWLLGPRKLYCGVAPGTTEASDVVALIAGVSMLMVLRAVEGAGDRFHVVGPLFTSVFGNGALERVSFMRMDDLGKEIVLC